MEEKLNLERCWSLLSCKKTKNYAEVQLQFINYSYNRDFMCLHFGLVATDALDIVSFAKHFVFTSVGQDQKYFPQPFLFKLSIHTAIGCLKGEKNYMCYSSELILLQQRRELNTNFKLHSLKKINSFLGFCKKIFQLDTSPLQRGIFWIVHIPFNYFQILLK